MPLRNDPLIGIGGQQVGVAKAIVNKLQGISFDSCQFRVPDAYHENITRLVAFVDSVVHNGSIKYHNVSVDPLPSGISDPQAALVFARIGNVQGQVTRQDKVGEIGMRLDICLGLHTGKEYFDGRDARLVDRLGRLGKEVDIDVIPSTPVHQDQGTPAGTVAPRVLGKGTGPNIVALLLQTFHVGRDG